MSRVKDLMHAILNENIDDIEEEKEVVEEVVEEVAPVKEEPTFVAPKIKPVPQTEEAAVEPKVEVVEPRKPSIFDGMEIESIQSATVRPKRKSYKYDRSKLANKNRLQEDLEYTPIISPIFGNTEDEKKQYDKVHDAIKLNKPDDDFGFTKIISPMWGKNIPTPKPVESIPTKTVEETKEDITLSDMLEKSPKAATKQESLFESEE